MSKRIIWAGLFSVILLSVVWWKAANKKMEIDGPAMVAMYEGPADLSLRGIHATQDTVVIVGGNKGIVGWSLDAGLHWIFTQIPGAGDSQFRSVWAHNPQTFIAVTAGAPSYIYRTTDGGHHWDRTFTDTAASTFLDGVTFANENLGWVYGDPVNGSFKLLKTEDGGATWQETNGPEAIDGEASFAASNGGILWNADMHTLSIISGGAVSRLHLSTDSGQTWTDRVLPVVQGTPSQGAFGHVFDPDYPQQYHISGGDFMADTVRTSTAATLVLAAGQEQQPTLDLSGAHAPYCSDVEVWNSGVYLVGTQGVFSFQNGSLQELDTTSMHALARSGDYIYLSGPHGRIGRIVNQSEVLNQLVTDLKEVRKSAERRRKREMKAAAAEERKEQ